MTRKSQFAIDAESRFGTAIIPNTRPSAPSEFNVVEAAKWDEVVTAMPPGWFTPETFPLLKALCTVASSFEMVSKKLRKMTSLDDDHMRLLAMQLRLAEAVKQLSIRLKIAPVHRQNPNTAMRATKDAVIAQRHKRPWEANGEAEEAAAAET